MLVLVGVGLQAQSTNRTWAAITLADLKQGAIVVRLKTNDNSVNAYRNAGRADIADRIIRDREAQNRKIAAAFAENLDFCSVHFIYAKDSRAVLDGRTDVFLTKDLTADTAVNLAGKFLLFAEYGEITANLRGDEYHYSAVNKTEASTSTSGTNVIFLSDTTFTQLREPFPFYQGVFLDNYNKAVERMNRALFRSYFNLVEAAEMKKKWKK